MEHHAFCPKCKEISGYLCGHEVQKPFFCIRCGTKMESIISINSITK